MAAAPSLDHHISSERDPTPDILGQPRDFYRAGMRGHYRNLQILGRHSPRTYCECQAAGDPVANAAHQDRFQSLAGGVPGAAPAPGEARAPGMRLQKLAEQQSAAHVGQSNDGGEKRQFKNF